MQAIPIEKRGIDGAWLFRLMHEVQEYRNQAFERYESQRKAASYFDHVPDPPYPSLLSGELTGRSFVAGHVVPWTEELGAPLFARVPPEHRGSPALFLSYTWSSGLLAYGYGVIYAIARYLVPGSLVWVDSVRHNQHSVGSVTRQMQTVISSVDTLLLPISEIKRFEKVWCIWEVICAHRLKKEIMLLEYARKHRDFRPIHSRFLDSFRSIADGGTSFPEDKEEILGLAIQIFGSIYETDRYLVVMMKEQLSSRKM